MATAKKDSAQIVTAPLVIAKTVDGGDVYLYRGSTLPENGLAEGEAKRLAEFLGTPDDLADTASDV